MNYFLLLGVTLLGSVLGLLGGIVFLYNKKWSVLLEQHAIPFAAGVMITTAFIGILPEALELISTTALWVTGATFFTAHFFEQLVLEIHHHQHDHSHEHHGGHHTHSTASTFLIIVGDTIHNLIDGVAIGASFLVSPALGFFTAFSTFLHEIPHEIGDFGVLLEAKWKKTDIILINVLSALVTVAGAFAVVLWWHSEVMVGWLLAIAAGIFLYLGTVDFLPRVAAKTSSKQTSFLPLLLGVAIIVASVLLLPHGHEEEAHELHEDQTSNVIETQPIVH